MDTTQATYYQSPVGELRWMVELGRIDMELNATQATSLSVARLCTALNGRAESNQYRLNHRR
jgi:hypothetical protein